MPFIYLVSSKNLNFFKLGYTRTNGLKIYNRYKTYYGAEIKTYLFPCISIQEEIIFHKQFYPHRYANSRELYKKEFFKECSQVCEDKFGTCQEFKPIVSKK